MTTTTALVIEAAAPPEGGPSLGPGSHGSLRIMADLGSGSRCYDGKLRMTEAHWLVPGMEVEVRPDPTHADRFEIDWASVPSMEARAAEGDPALADPVAARRKVAQALGLTQADTGTARTERVQRALEQAGTQPAPPGKQRAVNVPGWAPYSVYAPRFKCEVDLLEPLWMPLPGLVSDFDPTDVEILWNEVPGHDAQLMDRAAGAQAAQQASAAGIDIGEDG